MKVLLFLIFGLLISFSSFAQYGFTSSTPLPVPSPVFDKVPPGILLDGTKAFCYNWNSSGFISLDLPNFNNILSLNNVPEALAGDFISDGNMIGIAVQGGSSPNLYSQDFAISSITFLGAVTGFEPVSGWPFPVALAWDAKNEMMYCLYIGYNGWGSSSSFIYKIDLNTRVASLIGQIPGVDACMTLAYNNADGMLYTIDFNSNELIRLDPVSAIGTVIGSVGFTNIDGSFCESDFNDFSGEFFVSLMSEIWSVNPSNAISSLKATIPGTQLSVAINASPTSVPINWFYFMLVFIIPIVLIIRKSLF